LPTSVLRDRFLSWISSWILGSPWLCARVKSRLAPQLEVQARRVRLRRGSRFQSCRRSPKSNYRNSPRSVFACRRSGVSKP
jgi:hypothetical protein